MGSESENCLTCGHTEDSHFFDEEPYTSKKEGLIITARLRIAIVNNSEYSLKVSYC
jgi:hypothetical protein